MPELSLPRGFQAAGIACGIKPSGKRDLSLFVSTTNCAMAGVFTQNRVCGAPVKVSRQRVPSAAGRAVVINSGNANACTGQRGLDDAAWMTDLVAEHLACPAESILVCSTGIIGHFLPRPQLESGLRQIHGELSENSDAFVFAAEAMMTTDTFAKLTTREVSLSGQPVRVFGAAKGAAMIAPNMATMLAVILTDAVLSPEQADRMLRIAVDNSFNCISVDGHTSTSDSVLLLANGQSESGDLTEADLEAVQSELTSVCRELAQAIIRDGEGAEHFVTIRVRGAADRRMAHRAAQAVADSALVKTAITGNDPNWGRIVSAVGYSGIDIQEEQISLKLNGTLIYESGAPTDYDESAVSRSMKSQRDVLIELELDSGDAELEFWTTDLTADYVRLNSEYTT